MSTALTNLNEVEDRLRRLFSLVGEVGAAFAPNIDCAVTVADLTDPGFAINRGRRFQRTQGLVFGVATAVSWRADATVVITSLKVQGTNGAPVNLGYLSPPAADAGGYAAAQVPFIERPATQNDWAPISRVAGAAGGYTPNQQISSFQCGGAAVIHDLIYQPVVLQPLARLVLDVGVLAFGTCTIAGYVF